MNAKRVKKLPARPNLDHLRSQAKTLLGEMKKAKPSRGPRLADAQLAIARNAGFASWPALSRHVEQLRALEGDWRFENLEVDGHTIPSSALRQSRLLLDGDRFRAESPEANYQGIFTIDVEVRPAHIDIAFVEGPDAGETCYGIYELRGDSLALCLGVVGAPRPKAFASTPGSGHALERLRRASGRRPDNVEGGTPPPAEPEITDREDISAFDVPMSAVLRRLEGEWIAVELISDGKPMPVEWLAFGSRVARGNEVTVVFGGQKMVHAKVRIDETANPIAIDYLHLDGKKAGTVSRGLMEWIEDEVRFAMPAAGQPRPTSFDAPVKEGTLSRWRRK